MRVLLVEGDAQTSRLFSAALDRVGAFVVQTDQGCEAIDLAKVHDYDLMVLGGDLPDLATNAVLRRVRDTGVRLPVIITSHDSSLHSKVKALTLGADDYMVRPLETDELVARAKAVVRRSHGHNASSILAGDINVNMDMRFADVRGVPLHLTPTEYQIVELLALRMGSVVSKDRIISHVYAGRHEPGLKTVDVYLCNIRRKLRRAKSTTTIMNVWGRGHALRPAAEEGIAS